MYIKSTLEHDYMDVIVSVCMCICLCVNVKGTTSYIKATTVYVQIFKKYNFVIYNSSYFFYG